MEAPECPVCLTQYNFHKQYPRVLPCGHSLCTSCLLVLKDEFPTAEKVLKCPECNLSFKLDSGRIESLPRNIELMRVMDAFFLKNRKSSSSEFEDPHDQTGFSNEHPDQVLIPKSLEEKDSVVIGFTKPIDKCDKVLTGHANQISVILAWGNKLYTASFDKSIKIWDLEKGEAVCTITEHSNRVTSLVLANSNQWLISADYGAEIFIWELRHQEFRSNSRIIFPEKIKSWKDHMDWRFFGVLAMAVSETKVLFTGGGDRTVKAWSLEDFELISTLTGHTAPISSLQIVGDILYSASWDGTVRLWWKDFSTLSVLSCSSGNLVGVRSIFVEKEVVYCGLENGHIQAWRDNSQICSLSVHQKPVSSLCVAFGWLYSGDWEGKIQIQEIKEIEGKLEIDEESKSIDAHLAAVNVIYCSGNKLITGGADSSIKIWKRAED